jgi:hypothetical protein
MTKKIFLIIVTLITYNSKLLSQDPKAPSFKIFETSLKGVTKETTTLEKEFDVNGLVIIFSCNTCPFVVGNDNFEGWEKEYNQLYLKAKDSKMGLVLLNSNEAKRENEDSYKEMQKHAKAQKYQMSYLVDVDSYIANELGAKTTPHVYVFDYQRNLIYKGSISNKWDSSRTKDETYLVNLLEDINNKKTINYLETEPRGCSIKRKK